MALDTLKRRSRLTPQSTKKSISLLRERDILWFEKIHRHGALPSTYLLEYARTLGYTCEKFSLERLGDLFHEKDTPHKAPYLERPRQQYNRQLAYRPMIYDLRDAAKAALKERGKFRQYAPAHAQSMWWHHDFMLATITASIELACLKHPSEFEYIFHDEICEAMGHALSFDVTYDDHDGHERTALLKPDRAFGIRYLKEKSVRYYLLEADRGTETIRSTDAGRKRLIDNYLQYRQFIGGHDYRQALDYDGGIVLLSVFTREARMRTLMEGLKPNNYMAFACLPDFDPDMEFIVPPPMPELFKDGWKRVEREDFYINK